MLVPLKQPFFYSINGAFKKCSKGSSAAKLELINLGKDFAVTSASLIARIATKLFNFRYSDAGLLAL